MELKNIKKNCKRGWDFLWHDDSLLSLVVFIILIFIFVKFIFFPILSLATATSLPIVVVESGSMQRPGSFFEDNFQPWWDEKGSWYEEINIEKEHAREWPFKRGLYMGDIVFVVGYGEIEIGDIIIFEANKRYPIIHRVVEIKEENDQKIYSTKGDNNEDQLTSEKRITEEDILGNAVFRVPKIGWIRLGISRIFS